MHRKPHAKLYILDAFIRVAAIAFALVSMEYVANAELAPTLAVPSSKFIAYYDTLKKQRTLTQEESDTLTLVQVGRDALLIETLHPGKMATEDLSIKSMEAVTVAFAIHQAVKKLPKWSVSLSKPALQEVNAAQEVLVKYLGPISIAWAWFEFQRGKRDSAKKILGDLFDRNYESIMAAKEIMTTPDEPGPLIEVTQYLNALEMISSKREQAPRREKLRDMEEHVKKIPVHKGVA